MADPLVMRPRSYLIARLTWASGEPIPVDLAMELTALGYDVSSLEQRYLR